MKILLAADGSTYTKKALAFIVANEELAGADAELVVLNVQPPLPPRVKAMVGAAACNAYQREEADKVLLTVERFLKRHTLAFRTQFVVGQAAAEVVRIAAKEKAHMILMGTHGHGLIGRAVMGSVAQRVLLDAKVPVLLVK